MQMTEYEICKSECKGDEVCERECQDNSCDCELSHEECFERCEGDDLCIRECDQCVDECQEEEEEEYCDCEVSFEECEKEGREDCKDCLDECSVDEGGEQCASDEQVCLDRNECGCDFGDDKCWIECKDARDIIEDECKCQDDECIMDCFSGECPKECRPYDYKCLELCSVEKVDYRQSRGGKTRIAGSLGPGQSIGITLGSLGLIGMVAAVIYKRRQNKN